MKTNHLLAFSLVLGAIAAPSLSQAHFLWANVDAKSHSVVIGFQEVPGMDPLPLGVKSTLVKSWLPSGKAVELKPDGSWFKGESAATSVAASLDYGVIDRHEQGRGVFWLKYYAKGASTAQASQTRLKLPMELFTKAGAGGKPVITVVKDGHPAAGADVVIEDKEGKPVFQGKTESDGTVVLPADDGPIQVRALVTEKTPGSHDGKAYELIRTYSTLTVESLAGKPLTRQLRDSFGNMHEIVSNTAFINTITTGNLTKPQLEQHLQQRAFVHTEMDRVLSHSKKPLPYGTPQKDVITLLKDDLQGMGSTWPTPSQEWPITRDFVNQIKQSTKKGPYYALGAFHVYYGGITHGGRDIGDMIEHQIKIHLNYYEKSDGYADYAKGVDLITDPTAQQEMIRGADDAYHYIIAINNLDAFKPTKSN